MLTPKNTTLLLAFGVLLAAGCGAGNSANQSASAGGTITRQRPVPPNPGASGPTPLMNTYWRLTRVGGKPVVAGRADREPHLTLIQEDRRVAATGGCNQMIGNFELEGDSLTFSSMKATKMLCQGVMDQENALARAFDATRSYRIRGNVLELVGSDGEALARFETVAPAESN